MLTYTRESDTAVSTLGSSSELLEMVVYQLATRSFNNAPPVGGGVVGCALADRDSLGHGDC